MVWINKKYNGSSLYWVYTMWGTLFHACYGYYLIYLERFCEGGAGMAPLCQEDLEASDLAQVKAQTPAAGLQSVSFQPVSYATWCDMLLMITNGLLLREYIYALKLSERVCVKNQPWFKLVFIWQSYQGQKKANMSDFFLFYAMSMLAPKSLNLIALL